MSRLRRIYVDSRYRSSGSPASFSYNLPGGSVEIPADTVCVLDSFICHNTFKTVQDWNRRVYFREVASGGGVTDKWAELLLANHNVFSLALAVGASLNNATTFSSGVLGGNVDPPYACIYDNTTGQIRITLKTIYDGSNPPVQANIGTSFKIWSREELQTTSAWTGTGGFALDITALHDASEIIGNVSGSLALASVGSLASMPEFPDINPIKQIFVHSKTLGHRSSLGPSGETTIIRRVPCISNYGETIFDNLSQLADHFEIGGSQLSQIDFELRDSNGRLVPLTRHCSFSLLMVPLEYF
jgi:hypothetical protein